MSGVVSNHKAGETVAIYYRPYPQPNLIQRTTILTSDGGNYSFIVAPGILTTYEAAWKGAFSTPVDRAGAAEPVARAQQRLDRPRLRVAVVRRPLGADPAPERVDRPVGDASARCS